MRRLLVFACLFVCVAAVIAYQATSSRTRQTSDRVFVPNPQTFLKLSPSYRTSVADLYYLGMMQYYGENRKAHKLASLPEMTTLITDLSPKFKVPYYFGSFALVDAGAPEKGKALLEKGFRENPNDYLLASLNAFFTYKYEKGAASRLEAARWYEIAAKLPGAPAHTSRLAAVMLAKGGETEKAIIMWGEVYVNGDKYARAKAVDGIDRLLPKDKQARMKAAAPLYQTMPKEAADALIGELFRDYLK